MRGQFVQLVAQLGRLEDDQGPTLVLRVAFGACVEYLPDQTIPYAGARYETVTRLSLASGGRALLWDLLAPGRH